MDALSALFWGSLSHNRKSHTQFQWGTLWAEARTTGLVLFERILQSGLRGVGWDKTATYVGSACEVTGCGYLATECPVANIDDTVVLAKGWYLFDLVSSIIWSKKTALGTHRERNTQKSHCLHPAGLHPRGADLQIQHGYPLRCPRGRAEQVRKSVCLHPVGSPQ